MHPEALVRRLTRAILRWQEDGEVGVVPKLHAWLEGKKALPVLVVDERTRSASVLRLTADGLVRLFDDPQKAPTAAYVRPLDGVEVRTRASVLALLDALGEALRGLDRGPVTVGEAVLGRGGWIR